MLQRVSSLNCTQKIIKNLKTCVFAGGGIKCLAYVGALQELRDSLGVDFGAKSPKLEQVVGVSAGTLISLMIVLGYSVAEITESSSLTNVSDIIETDISRIICGEISIDCGEKLKIYVESLLTTKGIKKNITFKELFLLTNISFIMYATDLDNCSIVTISEQTYPSLQVVEGMLASMSLPLIYPPVMSPGGNMWVDGGILENYPISRFAADTTLGFDFTSSTSLKADSLINFVLRVMAVQQAPLDYVAWKSLSELHKKHTVLIDTGKMSFIKAIADNVNLEARESILKAGKEAIFQKILEWETLDSSNQLNMKENVFRNLLNNGPTYLNV